MYIYIYISSIYIVTYILYILYIIYIYIYIYRNLKDSYTSTLRPHTWGRRATFISGHLYNSSMRTHIYQDTYRVRVVCSLTHVNTEDTVYHVLIWLHWHELFFMSTWTFVSCEEKIGSCLPDYHVHMMSHHVNQSNIFLMLLHDTE